MKGNVATVEYSIYHIRVSDYKILSADANFEKITGYTRQDYETGVLKHTDLIPKTDIVEYLGRLREDILCAGHAYYEHRMQKKNGDYIVVLCLGKNYLNPETGEEEAEIMITDVSDASVFSAIRANDGNYLEMSRHDLLTGLFNRGAFEEKVDLDLEQRREGMCAMLLIDVDNLKVINDVYGHQTGDLAINLIASCLVTVCRKGALLSRTGGDEFCVFIPAAISQQDQQALAAQIIRAIQKIELPDFTGVRISASIGIVYLKRRDATFQILYNDVVVALFQAKETGRNRAELYSSALAKREKFSKSVLLVGKKRKRQADIRRIFETRFNIIEARSDAQAVHIINEMQDKLAVVLTELYAHEIDGFVILDYMRKMDYIQTVPVVFLADEYIEDVYKNAYSHGVIDIVTEPIDSYSLSSRLNNIMDLYQHKNNLEVMTQKQTEKIQRQNEKIINSLGTVVEFRDMESGAHIQRVKTFTTLLAKQVMAQWPEYELTAHKIKCIAEASPLHDVGKIAISDTILLKPGKLTPAEFEIMKTHTTKGFDIIMRLLDEDELEYVMYCSSIAKYHHEKYDGRGYPEGLAGDDIPISAQIVSVADAYDALVSKRCYKDAFSYETAFNMIVNGDCGVFNPKLIQCLYKVRSQFEEQAEKLRD